MEDMEISRHYTLSDTPSRTVWRIYALVKKTVSTGYFIKETKKNHFRVPIHYINSRGSLKEFEIV